MSDVLETTLEAPLPLSLLAAQPADALLGLIALYRADARPGKIDPGRDRTGGGNRARQHAVARAEHLVDAA